MLISVLQDVQCILVIRGFKYASFLFFFIWELSHQRPDAPSGHMKQVIVIRSDLDISPGKWATQAAHASVTAAGICQISDPLLYKEWQRSGQKKVVLKGKDENHLHQLKAKAESLGLPTALILDAGLTEVKPGTVTALGIGPGQEKLIDKVTGSLPLF